MDGNWHWRGALALVAILTFPACSLAGDAPEQSEKTRPSTSTERFVKKTNAEADAAKAHLDAVAAKLEKSGARLSRSHELGRPADQVTGRGRLYIFNTLPPEPTDKDLFSDLKKEEAKMMMEIRALVALIDRKVKDRALVAHSPIVDLFRDINLRRAKPVGKFLDEERAKTSGDPRFVNDVRSKTQSQLTNGDLILRLRAIRILAWRYKVVLDALKGTPYEEQTLEAVLAGSVATGQTDLDRGPLLARAVQFGTQGDRDVLKAKIDSLVYRDNKKFGPLTDEMISAITTMLPPKGDLASVVSASK